MTDTHNTNEHIEPLTAEEVKSKAFETFASTFDNLSQSVPHELVEVWDKTIKDLLSTVINRVWQHGYDSGKSSLHRGEE